MSAPPESLTGRTLHDRDDRPLGRIQAVYRYPHELAMPWGAAAVVSGRIRRTIHLVDLQDATIGTSSVRVPYPRATITAAPHFTPLVGDTLAASHAERVVAHYHPPD